MRGTAGSQLLPAVSNPVWGPFVPVRRRQVPSSLTAPEDRAVLPAWVRRPGTKQSTLLASDGTTVSLGTRLCREADLHRSYLQKGRGTIHGEGNAAANSPQQGSQLRGTERCRGAAAAWKGRSDAGTTHGRQRRAAPLDTQHRALRGQSSAEAPRGSSWPSTPDANASLAVPTRTEKKERSFCPSVCLACVHQYLAAVQAKQKLLIVFFVWLLSISSPFKSCVPKSFLEILFPEPVPALLLVKASQKPWQEPHTLR